MAKFKASMCKNFHGRHGVVRIPPFNILQVITICNTPHCVDRCDCDEEIEYKEENIPENLKVHFEAILTPTP